MNNILISNKISNKIKNSLFNLNLNLYDSKTLMRYKHMQDNFIIANILKNKFLVIHEEKPSSSTDSIIINFILDYLIKLLKE